MKSFCFSNKLKVKLTVRIVNQRDNLGNAFEKATDYIDYAEFIFMDYYGKLKSVLNKYCVANKENYLQDDSELSFHPLVVNKLMGILFSLYILYTNLIILCLINDEKMKWK